LRIGVDNLLLDKRFDICLSRWSLEPHVGRRPTAEQGIATGGDLESQLLVEGEFAFERAFASIVERHHAIVFCRTRV
jgi:hypothetical protein